MTLKFHNTNWRDSQTKLEVSKKKRPIIDDDCPKCDGTKMYFWFAQIRSVDEGQTTFHECVKCGYISNLMT